MVVEKKRNGKMRLCIDPKFVNRALKRSHYPLPILEDILPRLSKAKVFTVVDARNGFWQVKLDKESSEPKTMATFRLDGINGWDFRLAFCRPQSCFSGSWMKLCAVLTVLC